MSAIRDILADTIVERQGYTGESCVNLATNEAFTAEVEEIQDTELNTELGRDARETIILHVGRVPAANLKPQGTVRITLYGAPTDFRILRRKDNPGSSQVDFGCMKILPGIDA